MCMPTLLSQRSEDNSDAAVVDIEIEKVIDEI